MEARIGKVIYTIASVIQYNTTDLLYMVIYSLYAEY